MKKPAIFLFLLYILTSFPVFSQNSYADEENISETEESSITLEQPQRFEDDQRFIISDFDFNIIGRTRPNSLIYHGELRRGEIILGITNLEHYIRDKTQLLINQRVLKDNVEINYIIGDQDANGSYPVFLYINVEDSWNIIALPRPRYSTNTGVELLLNARDFNFLGTMNPLRFDLGYRYDYGYDETPPRHSFTIDINSDIPFNAFGYTWNFLFNNRVSYRHDVDEPFFFRNITGLSMDFPLHASTITFGFQEYFVINEENPDQQKEKYGNFQTGLYMSTRMFTYWDIPTGLHISRFGELTYTPEITARFNHQLSDDWRLHEFRRGPFLNFSHSLGFGRINWHRNYREGVSASIKNTITYDFYRLRNEENPISSTITISGIGHIILSDFFAISSRLQFRHWFYPDVEFYDQAGDNLRGILDRSITANYMLSLNTDFPFRVLEFTPSEWLNNQRLRFFDFEFHISPVIDMALYNDPKTGTSFSLENFITTGGFEFLVFPAFFRSLYVRLCFAWNIHELLTARPFTLPGGSNREITFIMRHFY